MAQQLDAPDDWAAQLTGKVEQVVALIRDRTVKPVQKIVAGIIFGVIAFAIVVSLVVLFSVFVLRLLDTFFFPGEIWASYLVLSGIFWIAGLLVYSQRHSRA